MISKCKRTPELKLFIFFLLALTVSSNAQDKQNKKYNQVSYSLGIIKTTVIDEFDNSIVYSGNSFQPFSFFVRIADEKWKHEVSFYYMKFSLNPVIEAENYEFNYLINKTGEIRYNVLRKIPISNSEKFGFYAGLGIHGFGANRQHKFLYKPYPYEDFVYSYDVNAASLHVVIHPEVLLGRNIFSFYASSGILNYVARPNNYNPLFNSNEGKWDLTAFSRHFNVFGSFRYIFNVSERIVPGFEYRYSFYKYTFPYTLKVLNQNFLGTIIFKF